jgi:tetratricopeptide (TPR) repeat protein
MRKLPILIAALALSAPAWGQGTSNREVCHGAMTAPDAAIAACTALLEEDRDSPVDLAKDLANRAFAQLAKGQADLAIADATRAIRVKADYAFAYNIRGIAHADKGLTEYAVVDFSKAIYLKPDYADALFNRGNRYLADAALDKAIADYSVAITINPQHGDAHVNRGNAWRDKGEEARALADYARAIALNPNDAKAWYNRGKLRNAKRSGTGR